MKKEQIQVRLENYREACQAIARAFTIKYFGYNVETDWVADEIGGVAMISDYFFSMNDMVDYLQYKYGVSKMFEHYNYKLDLSIENSEIKDNRRHKTIINIQNYKKLKN